LPALQGGASLYPWAYHLPPEKLIRGADNLRLIPAGFPQNGQSISIGAEKLESFSSLALQATQQYSYSGIFSSGLPLGRSWSLDILPARAKKARRAGLGKRPW